ncbi:phosphatase PAP2 family protein [Desulfovibrio sp. OttesenSCG-928-A18]|nr:phosphatase PAP2 family protein [Desulfovibrio sp. OttesenSCG-928-A18]
MNARQSVPLAPFLLRQAVFLLPLFLMVGILKLTHGGSIAPMFSKLRLEYPALAGGIKFFSTYGNAAFYCVYALLLLLSILRRNGDGVRLVLAYILVQCTVTLIAVMLMKHTAGRPRPYTMEADWRFFTDNSSYHSLPSGHTAEIGAAAGPFAQRAKSIFITLLWGLFPAAMGFSRLFRGMHHPADILVGAVIASLSCYCILLLALRMRSITRRIEPLRRWGLG